MHRKLAVAALLVAGSAGFATLATSAQAAEWSYIADYNTHAECEAAGKDGQSQGKWTTYQCVQGDAGSWSDSAILYVQY